MIEIINTPIVGPIIQKGLLSVLISVWIGFKKWLVGQILGSEKIITCQVSKEKWGALGSVYVFLVKDGKKKINFLLQRFKLEEIIREIHISSYKEEGKEEVSIQLIEEMVKKGDLTPTLKEAIKVFKNSFKENDRPFSLFIFLSRKAFNIPEERFLIFKIEISDGVEILPKIPFDELTGDDFNEPTKSIVIRTKNS